MPKTASCLEKTRTPNNLKTPLQVATKNYENLQTFENGKLKINFYEFQEQLQNSLSDQAEKEETLNQMFNFLDRKRAGNVTAEDLVYVFGVFGLEICYEDAKRYMSVMKGGQECSKIEFNELALFCNGLLRPELFSKGVQK